MKREKLQNTYFPLQLMMTTTMWDHTSVTCARSVKSWDAVVDDAYRNHVHAIVILGLYEHSISSVCIVFNPI